MKVTIISIVISALGAVTKGLILRLEDLEISGRVETIVDIGQNTERSPGNLRRLAVIQDTRENSLAYADEKKNPQKVTIIIIIIIMIFLLTFISFQVYLYVTNN